jgi:hypothetical protein
MPLRNCTPKWWHHCPPDDGWVCGIGRMTTDGGRRKCLEKTCPPPPPPSVPFIDDKSHTYCSRLNTELQVKGLRFGTGHLTVESFALSLTSQSLSYSRHIRHGIQKGPALTQTNPLYIHNSLLSKFRFTWLTHLEPHIFYEDVIKTVLYYASLASLVKTFRENCGRRRLIASGLGFVGACY